MRSLNYSRCTSLPHSRGEIVLEPMSKPGAWCLWLDNPDARNALSIGMMCQLETHLHTLLQRDARFVVIRGSNKHFCSGGDLKDVREHLMEPLLGQMMCSYMTDVLHRYQQSTMFVLVAVEGAALGGGAELTTVGDYVVAEPSATVAFVQAKLGVTPGWGGGQRLINKIGSRKTLQALVTAGRLSAVEAKNFGIVDCVHDDIETEIERVMNSVLNVPVDCLRH